jgi:hypothetical protein
MAVTVRTTAEEALTMPNRPPSIVVLASTRERFNAWCYDSGLSPHDPDLLYAGTPDKLRGLTTAKVIRTRDWRLNRHADRLEVDVARIEQRSRQS